MNPLWTIVAWALPAGGVLFGLGLRRRAHLRRLRAARVLTGHALDALAVERRAHTATRASADAAAAAGRRTLGLARAVYEEAVAEVTRRAAVLDGERSAAQAWGLANLRRAWAAEDMLRAAEKLNGMHEQEIQDLRREFAEYRDSVQQVPHTAAEMFDRLPARDERRPS